MPDYLIVGIGGVTNGGKTSLCRFLTEKFPGAYTINMDEYYLPEDSPRHIWLDEFKYNHWEVTTAIDFERLVKDVEKWISNISSTRSSEQVNAIPHLPLLLVEGILIMNNKPLMSHFQKKYFFSLTKSQCWERRQHRIYASWQPAGYFDHVVWKTHIKYKDELKDERDIVYLDGSGDRQQIFDRVYEDIVKCMQAT